MNERDIHADHLDDEQRLCADATARFDGAQTPAKTVPGLQRTLDVYWVIHNFVRKHWTAGEIPAVAMGVLCAPSGLEDILMMRK